MLLSVTFVGVLKTLILIFFFLIALLLVLVVMFQEAKGGGLAAAFGGAGAETFGVQSGSVNKFTTYVAALFLILAVAYAMVRPPEIGDVSPTDRAGSVSAPGGTGATEEPGKSEKPGKSDKTDATDGDGEKKK